VALLTGAGLDTLAVRVPAHPVALALLRLAGTPVAAPSANRSGAVSPTSVQHVLLGLSGRIAAVLDSGPCAVGVESTVLDLSRPAPFLLRPGGVTVEDLEAVIGPIQRGGSGSKAAPLSPGMMESHYAPDLPVRLNARAAEDDEVLLAFGPPLPGARGIFQLSAGCDTAEAAVRLFEGLRWLDTEARRVGAARIAVMPVPDRGLGVAINDRLQRAAAPRPL
jgi:L-threonylcarbamoyladenylate synthase